MSEKCFLCGGQVVDGKCISCGLDNRKNDRKYRLNTHNDSGAHFHDGDCEDHINEPRRPVFSMGRRKKQTETKDEFDYRKLLEEERRKVHSGSNYRKGKNASSSAAGKSAQTPAQRAKTGTVKKSSRFPVKLIAVLIILAALLVNEFGAMGLDRMMFYMRYYVRRLLSGNVEQNIDWKTADEDSNVSGMVRNTFSGHGEEVDLSGFLQRTAYDSSDPSYYTSLLENGFYDVGYDLPEGTFQFYCDAADGQDVTGALTLYRNEDYDSLAVIASPAALKRMVASPDWSLFKEFPTSTCSPELTLKKGDQVLLENFDDYTIYVEGYMQEEGTQKHPRQPITEKVELKDKMVVGEDFEEGVYDISLNPKADTYFSWVTLTDDSTGEETSHTFYLTSAEMHYRRIPFAEGMEIGIEKANKGSILLTPSY